MSDWVCPGSARLRKPYSGPGVPDAGQATGGPQGRRARIPPLRAAQGRASVGTELRAGSCDVPGANSDVASSTPALLSAAAARGTAGWGFGGAVQAPGPEVGAGAGPPLGGDQGPGWDG